MKNTDLLKLKAQESIFSLRGEGYKEIKTTTDLMKVVKEIESKKLSFEEVKEKSIIISNIISYFAHETTDLDIYQDEQNNSYILSNGKRHLNIAPTIEWCLSLNICHGFLLWGDLASLKLPHIFVLDNSIKFNIIPQSNGYEVCENILKHYDSNFKLWQIDLLDLGYGDSFFNHNSLYKVEEHQLNIITNLLKTNSGKNTYTSSLIHLIIIHLWLFRGFMIESITQKDKKINTCVIKHGNSSIEIISFLEKLLYTQLSEENLNAVGIKNILYDSFEIIPRLLKENHQTQIVDDLWNAVRSKLLNEIQHGPSCDMDYNYERKDGIYEEDDGEDSLCKYNLFKAPDFFAEIDEEDLTELI